MLLCSSIENMKSAAVEQKRLSNKYDTIISGKFPTVEEENIARIKFGLESIPGQKTESDKAMVEDS
ncbi:hypothetical protein DFP95_107238 [Cohnella lupini]|uniref:Uncharacterized protein n=1 Tax=Cohnella lupini TaxID=1294267 RepID=A0A3D9ICX8_9BACL|nr:hypothetical protein DFP95_107238 [Cohnella lupini]